eukprot:1903112-Prymnesium_polylepis.1
MLQRRQLHTSCTRVPLTPVSHALFISDHPRPSTQRRMRQWDGSIPRARLAAARAWIGSGAPPLASHWRGGTPIAEAACTLPTKPSRMRAASMD